MDENTVGSAPVAEQVVAPVDAGQAREISITDLVEMKPSAETPAKTKPQESPPPAPVYKSQKEIDAAFGAEKKRVARQYETSPEYQLGKVLVEERMAKDGVSKEEAKRRIEEDRRKALAATFKEKPEEGFDYLLRQREQTTKQPEPEEALEPNSIDDKALRTKFQSGAIDEPTARAAGSFVRKAVEDGVLPADFDPKADMTKLVADWTKYGFDAAAEMLVRSRAGMAANAADPIAERRNEPQPIRTTGESTQRGNPDYNGMDDRKFLDMWKDGKKAIASGKVVKV